MENVPKKTGFEKIKEKISTLFGGEKVNFKHYQNQLGEYHLPPMKLPTSLKKYRKGKYKKSVKDFKRKYETEGEESFNVFSFPTLDDDINQATLEAKSELKAQYYERIKLAKDVLNSMSSTKSEMETQIERLEKKLEEQNKLIAEIEAPDEKFLFWKQDILFFLFAVAMLVADGTILFELQNPSIKPIILQSSISNDSFDSFDSLSGTSIMTTLCFLIFLGGLPIFLGHLIKPNKGWKIASMITLAVILFLAVVLFVYRYTYISDLEGTIVPLIISIAITLALFAGSILHNCSKEKKQETNNDSNDNGNQP